ncbi:MAG: HDIG domain-containing metalloprotein [Kiritimatiellia bacterium]
MKATVSKERKRKAKRRQKLAGRELLNGRHRTQRPAVAIFAAVLTWAVALIGLPMLVPPPPALATIIRPDFLSNALLGLAAFAATGIFLLIFRPALFLRNSRVILLCIISTFGALCSSVLLQSGTHLGGAFSQALPLLLPTVLAPLLAALLLGAHAAVAIGTLSAAMMAIYAERSLAIMTNGTLATILIAYLAPRVRTRSKAVKVCLYAGIIQVPLCAMLAFQSATQPFRLDIFAMQLSTCVLAALLFALLALVVLPLLEHVFNITTNISLLEFSDLGHPLLQRLALEAPGTYHHSLVVANIAQAAAEAIGANSLEARVSAYFHDIGKLTKPTFFAENIFSQPNPHDQLSPNMSTLIITSHVKEGLSMAQLYKLPDCVHRAIQEHHGSSILQCFHHKALTAQQEFELLDGSTRRLDDGQFRYPGPKPSTRVSAIICLADAVEAASRSIAKPSPTNLEDLVNDIVQRRFEDGQLDDCEISLLELSKVKRAFVFTLANMLHGRVAYPDSHENKNTKPSDIGLHQSDRAADADENLDATCASA